jgi:hypothetical protein
MSDTEEVSKGQWSDVDYALTTVDNPFNPFTEFIQWFGYDTTHGYHSAGLLARVARSSDELSDADQHAAVQAAIDEIVRENVSGMHRKISRSGVIGSAEAQPSGGEKSDTSL